MSEDNYELPTEEKAEQTQDSMDLDDLRAKIDSLSDEPDRIVEEEEPLLPDEEGAEEAAAEPEPEGDGDVDDRTEPEDEEEEQAASAEDEAAPEQDSQALSPEDGLPEAARLRVEEAELRAQRFESLAGRHAGELGFLKQKLRELEQNQRNGARRSADEFDQQDAYPREPARPEPSRSDDATKAFLLDLAIGRAGQQFAADHPDYVEFKDEIRSFLEKSKSDFEATLTSDDPVQAAKEARRYYEDAYYAVRESKLAERRKALESKRADQAASLKQKKRATAVSSTEGVKRAAPKTNKPRTVKDLSTEQLRKAIDAGAGL